MSIAIPCVLERRAVFIGRQNVDLRRTATTSLSLLGVALPGGSQPTSSSRLELLATRRSRSVFKPVDALAAHARRFAAVLVLVLLAAPACMSSRRAPSGPPPADPIAVIDASELRAQGLDFARTGDLTRAQQYLAAAYAKGFDESIVLPEIVKVCVAASRLRAALSYAEPYLDRHPGDAGMSYVVGSIHLALGNLQRAAMHLNGALEPGELAIDAAYSLALVAHRQGHPQEAREHLQHYLRVAPKGGYATRAKRLLASLVGSEITP